MKKRAALLIALVLLAVTLGGCSYLPTVLLADISDFAAMNAVYAQFFQSNCPARAAFAVKDLPKGALVEIEVIAGK